MWLLINAVLHFQTVLKIKNKKNLLDFKGVFVSTYLNLFCVFLASYKFPLEWAQKWKCISVYLGLHTKCITGVPCFCFVFFTILWILDDLDDWPFIHNRESASSTKCKWKLRHLRETNPVPPQRTRFTMHEKVCAFVNRTTFLENSGK